MAQFKIHGYRSTLAPRRDAMSDVVHAAATTVLGLPDDKRAHRFFLLDREDFRAPAGRSDDYTIVEVLMFAGRTTATKKALYRDLYERFERDLGIASVDLEIIVLETPRHDWGIRGLPGDELTDLTYQVDI
jgi:hypothetical protein